MRHFSLILTHGTSPFKIKSFITVPYSNAVLVDHSKDLQKTGQHAVEFRRVELAILKAQIAKSKAKGSRTEKDILAAQISAEFLSLKMVSFQVLYFEIMFISLNDAGTSTF